MKKIPTLFIREPNHGPVTQEVNPECAWVMEGKGEATIKFDGTCVMFDGDKWWSRREIKPGQQTPANFVNVDADDFTNKIMGWVPIEDSSFYRWFEEADKPDKPGTYELCGPKVQGNPLQFTDHCLIPHGKVLIEVERTFEGIKNWLTTNNHEGLVFWLDDTGSKMAKIKRKDFK